MNRRDLRITDPVEAVLVEQFLAMVHELRSVCRTAPDSHVLEQVEQVAVNQGRELTRKTLKSVLNEQAEEVEKKGRRREDVLAAELDRIAAGVSGRFSWQPGR